MLIFLVFYLGMEWGQWILNNFIEIYSNGYDISFYDYNYMMCPYLLVKSISKKFLKRNKLLLLETIIDNLDENKYAYLAINKSCISAYGRCNYSPHDIMIYGYSNDKKLFYIADCFEGGKYSYKTCTHKELDMAVSSLSELDELWFKGNIYFISLVESNYVFSANRLIKSFEDYLKGQPITCWNCADLSYRSVDYENWKFGIDTYEFLKQRIDSLKDNYIRANQIFTLFWDHKKHICKIIEYLNYKQFYDVISENEKNAIILRNLYLKYRLKEDTQILYKMQDILNKIENCERKVFPEIIHEIILNQKILL